MLGGEYNVLNCVDLLVVSEMSHLNTVMKEFSICFLVDIIAFITVPCKFNIFHYRSKNQRILNNFLCFENLS